MAEPGIQEILGKTFLTALLLTGTVERAEAAVLQSIKVLDADDISAEPLLQATVRCSIGLQSGIGGQEIDGLEHGSRILPSELKCVLHLPFQLRHCFVLRILAGFPREACASVLQLKPSQIDECTCSAILRLAELSFSQTMDSERQSVLPDRE